MSWFSKLVGWGVEVRGGKVTISKEGDAPEPVLTAAGKIIAEFDPNAVPQIISAVNNVLVNSGAAATEAEADALIESELAKIGLVKPAEVAP